MSAVLPKVIPRASACAQQKHGLQGHQNRNLYTCDVDIYACVCVTHGLSFFLKELDERYSLSKVLGTLLNIFLLLMCSGRTLSLRHSQPSSIQARVQLEISRDRSCGKSAWMCTEMDTSLCCVI